MEPLLLYVLDLASDAEPARCRQRQDPRTAVLPATELSATRGDGVFETILVRDGALQALEAHLDRFDRSARLLDLPEPRRDLWRDTLVTMAAELGERGGRTAIKFVLSRGDEAGSGAPTGWALGFVPSESGAQPPAPRDAVLLDRGYRHDVARTSPWLLQGAKTLSYAVNSAALREARRRGAEEVLFVSSDGFVLEGPYATVIARVDGVYVTPPSEFGVLPGTTQADVFAGLRADDQTVATRPLPIADLRRADAVWLCSSTRGPVPLRRIDDMLLTVDDAATARMIGHLDSREA